ncbi:hypothetical protein BHD05_03265 [Marisediminicola antarctica]|uniref:NAD-dependent epimerase/dehydratase domain-containing protein n=1 Tax=Marisediminicola antarctica TaxID=674079 RepID=A0A7L5ALH7_9MICO|nr:hypothetical protein BHD05_03265 [Marisediminicola antarctica]
MESALPSRAGAGLSPRWAVVGASGFIGSALVEELTGRGLEVVQIAAPRLLLDPSSEIDAVVAESDRHSHELESLGRRLSGVAVVVNAAGLAAPDSGADASLFGANTLLPVVIARAANAAGCARYIHLSSAAVQGRCEVLDESAATRPFSPYSRSKAVGEGALLAYLAEFDSDDSPEVVIVRATSVQGLDRATTVQLRRVATSPIASVARPGNRPSVVSSVRGLVDFVAEVGAHRHSVPTIVLQPWEGLTTSHVLELAGGRTPTMLPLAVCRAVLAVGFAAGSVAPPLRGIVRRVEVMWMGQAQNATWARSAGFSETETGRVADVLRGRAVEASRQ